MTEQETGLVPEGLEFLDQEDIIFPRIRLVQPTSKTDNGKPGDFVNDLTGEVFRERRLHVVRYYPGQALWDDESDVPICVSRDGKVPDPSIETPFAESCETCAKSQWIDNKPPDCAKTYSFVVIDLESGMPCTLQVSRTSAQAAKKILSFAFLNKLPLRELECKIASKEQRQGRGVYYIVTASEFARATNDAATALAVSEL